MQFPTRRGPSWELTEEQLRSWEQAFPTVNVKGECRKALTWLQANPKKLKANLPRFLVNWLSRAAPSAKPEMQYEGGLVGCRHDPPCESKRMHGYAVRMGRPEREG